MTDVNTFVPVAELPDPSYSCIFGDFVDVLSNGLLSGANDEVL